MTVKLDTKSSTTSLTTSSQYPNQDYHQELVQKTDTKYQEIIYWKFGRFEQVNPLVSTPIDLQKALHETRKLLWQYNESIGFSNANTKDAIHIQRVEKDLWDIQVPIFTKDEWDGYSWVGVTSTKIIIDVIKLFFEEVEWFGMLDLKMTKKSNQH